MQKSSAPIILTISDRRCPRPCRTLAVSRRSRVASAYEIALLGLGSDRDYIVARRIDFAVLGTCIAGQIYQGRIAAIAYPVITPVFAVDEAATGDEDDRLIEEFLRWSGSQRGYRFWCGLLRRLGGRMLRG